MSAPTAVAAPPHPPRACPKCGDPDGFVWSRPTFVDTWRDPVAVYRLHGKLRWACGVCGYFIYTRTADTPEGLER